jgi:hypothetical protein
MVNFLIEEVSLFHQHNEREGHEVNKPAFECVRQISDRVYADISKHQPEKDIPGSSRFAENMLQLAQTEDWPDFDM